MKTSESTARRGRPRSFDPDEALERGMAVFWRKGYEGASIADLTEAMGINRPSLYSAFGSKQDLFRRALDHYAEGPEGYWREALNEPTARAVAEHVLREAADLQTDPRNPTGCLTVQGALACGDDAEPIRQALISHRAEAQAAIRERFERALADGDLPGSSSPAELARYITVVVRGMSVEAAGGATREELEAVIQATMRAWPE